MKTNNQTWMTATKNKNNPPPPTKPWKPTGPTAKDLLGYLGQGINDIGQGVNNVAGVLGQGTNDVVGYLGEGANRAGGAINSAALKGAKTFNAVSKVTGNMTLPAREAAMEAAWKIVQQGNYFFGLPYSNGSYKDEIKKFSYKNKGAMPSGPHTQGEDPNSFLQSLTQLPGSTQYGMERAVPATPATPPLLAAPTQDTVNNQWLLYWNNQGPRPAAGTVYKPLK